MWWKRCYIVYGVVVVYLLIFFFVDIVIFFRILVYSGYDYGYCVLVWDFLSTFGTLLTTRNSGILVHI